MELIGIIHTVGENQNVSASFVKREFVLYVENEKNKDWSDYVKIELQQGNVDEMEKYKQGDKIKCHINLRGRLWTNPQGVEQCFNTIVGWKIELINSAPVAPQAAQAPVAPQAAQAAEESDALLF